MNSESKYDLLRRILLSPLLVVASHQSGNHSATIREAGTQSIEELVRPGHLVLTDDGRLGRVSRVIKAPESSHHSELELHGENGAKSIHSSRELRFIYCFDPDGHESAA
jgi:hypothetical protein